jgi:hypothetical protein
MTRYLPSAGDAATPNFHQICDTTPVSTEDSVPEEVDHREIAVRVQMVAKMKLLLASEPSEVCEPRSFCMVLLVKKYVCAERHRAGSGHYGKQIEWKN